VILEDSMRSTHRLFLLAVSLMPSQAWGQAVPSREPSSTHVFPAGGRRGTTVKVRVGGECFPPDMKFALWGNGVTAPTLLGARVNPRYESSARRLPRDADGIGAAITYPSEWETTLTIAADAPLGPKHWRVSGGWGGSRLRPFLVGDLPEFLETESNSEPEHAERITLPVVVNGQIAGERDLDFFVFAAKVGEVVVLDVLANRIGSSLDPVVEINDLKGRRMEVEEVRLGTDPVLAFRVPATGDYRVSIANVGFHGGPQYVYRMTISTAPFVAFAFPPGGKAGEVRDVDLYTLTGTGKLRAVKERVVFPSVPGSFRLRGSIPLVAGEHSEVVELNDNHSAKSAMELIPPLTVNGRFLTATEEDWFRLTVKKDDVYTIDCRPFPAASPALPVLTLLDATDRPLGKASAANTADSHCEIDWKVPADGTYRLRLRDLQHGTRGGPEFLYRLTVRPAHRDFALRLESDHLNVVQGGKAEVGLIVRRTGGFTGAIDLTAHGLPDGLRIEPARVAEGQTTVKLAVVAKADARPTDAPLRIRGKATIADKEVEHISSVAPWGLGSHAESRLPGANDLHLTVQHKPVFRLTCNEAYQYAHRGTIYPYPMQVERLNGFTGPITIQLCDRQVQDLDGIEVIETIVPSGVTEFKNRVYLPETMHVSVQHHSRPYAQGSVRFSDKWGQKQTLLAVSEKRCMIRTMPTLVRLRPLRDKVTARLGEEVTCKFALDRTANFTESMVLDMVKVAGFSAEKIRIPEGGNEAVVKIRMGKSIEGPTTVKLLFRATGELAVQRGFPDGR
jgi:hypothetical protein